MLESLTVKMEKQDDSQLTVFARYESEPSQSGVITFFNKFLKLPLFSPGETIENVQHKSISNETKEEQSQDQAKEVYEEIKSEAGNYSVELDGRSLPNVLKRISSLIAIGSSSGTRYADTELAQYWMPDDISKECYECAARFSALRRKHHCRVCGVIFCSRCCSQRVPGQIFNCAGGLRVCNYCCNIVLSYLREKDMTGEISPDLRTLQENLQVKFPENKSNSLNKAKDNFMFAPQHDETRGDMRPSPKEALQDVFRQLSFTLPTQQHRYRLIRYNGVWRGCDILQWIMDNTNNKTRIQASQVCQNLLNEGYMECMTELPKFADYALYRPIHIPPVITNEDSPEEGNRFVESVSSYCLDLNLNDSSARLIKAPKTETKQSPSSEEDNPVIERTESHGETKTLCRAIKESGEDHLKLLMRQCLARENLSCGWLDVLLPLCHHAADITVPDMYSNDIDIRNYVQVKKVPGGTMRDSRLVPGIVLTKNVAHRNMPQDLSNPSVLLLDCPIAYQRVEGKLTSLEPLLMQEQEYLSRCAARISALRPKIVLVRGSAARAVQDALRAEGVALATNVREAALKRVARCVRADIVTSIDARIGVPKLGTCTNFYVHNYSSKTLMILEGCAEPQLGCSILLRGSSLQELVRVKRVAEFMLLACYNWKLEKSFLKDIEAVLPETGVGFDEKCDEDAPEALDNKNLTIDIESLHDRSDVNDPLQLSKGYQRKTDSDKTLSCGVPIRDNSDPLRARQLSVDDEVFLPSENAKLQADANNDRWSVDDTVLSMSPNVIIPAPYLETEAGRKCPLRQYFHDPLFPPPRHRAVLTPRTIRRKISKHSEEDQIHFKDLHPFLTKPITTSVDDLELKALLANFRATGCRVVASVHRPECPMYKPNFIRKSPQKETELNQAVDKQSDPPDPLAPENHQKLSLLWYSYSNKSPNVPDFCVNPWIATMEMYGRHDISLGAFFDKFCFNDEFKCSSQNCPIPMNQHVRRFVHGDGCVTITCNTIGHSNVDKIDEEQSKQIMFWSRCGECGASSHACRLSRTSLALSFAKYVELRIRAQRYQNASACHHPIHGHAHYFAKGLTTACFRYNKITTWDIELPPATISTTYDTRAMREELIAQVNDLMLKGHETFTSLSESEAERDYAVFKQHMETIHLALTSTALQQHTTLAGVVKGLWAVRDRVVAGEKMLRDATDKWEGPPPPAPAPAPAKPAAKPTIDNGNAGEVFVCGTDDKSDIEDSGAGDSGTNEGVDAPTKNDNENQGPVEEDEEKGDKKTVRQILSQLLSNNQPLNQNGVIISGGLLPVVVFAGEIGSVVAATLASVQYQRQLYSLLVNGNQPEQEDAENVTSTGKDKVDGDKTKTKSNDHIEVLLKDGLLCRVYYAAQFHRLRAMLLAPLGDQARSGAREQSDKEPLRSSLDDCKTLSDVEEGFVRSLSRCVAWAARGGKSGSTFCKTTDDRYVLKEMSKPEWQQFLEFAPRYFSYVTSCHQNKLPSLLARIVGVYSVGGAGNGVLVMENLFYGRDICKRFDLKGSLRHRLAADPHVPGAVLMDENLLNLRWESQLYLASHTARVAWAGVERDTAFLAAHCVMDYSLLLGLEGGRLVVGIIDYIRTFTWDKKLEHYVKKNLGSGQPTVVSPEQYRSRFVAAMRKYFLHCPTQWDDLHRGLKDGP